MDHRGRYHIDMAVVKRPRGVGHLFLLRAGRSVRDLKVSAGWEVFFFKCKFLWTNARLVAEHRTLELESLTGIERHGILR